MILITRNSCGHNHKDKQVPLNIKVKAVYLSEDFEVTRQIANHGDTVIMSSYPLYYNFRVAVLNDTIMAVKDAIRRGNGPNELLEYVAAFDASDNRYIIIDSISGRVGN